MSSRSHWETTRASILVPTDAGARTSVGSRLRARGELAGVHRVAGLCPPGAVRTRGGRPADGAAHGLDRERESGPEAAQSAVHSGRLHAPARTKAGGRGRDGATTDRRRDGGVRGEPEAVSNPPTAARPSRALVSPRRRVPRAPGGPIDLDRDTAQGGPRSDQLERPVPAGVGEQPRALADDHGEDEQVELVDEVIVEQP